MLLLDEVTILFSLFNQHLLNAQTLVKKLVQFLHSPFSLNGTSNKCIGLLFSHAVHLFSFESK